MKATLLPLLVCLAAACAARADLIFLTPSAAIGGTPTFLDSDYKGELNINGGYVAGNLFNQQTGAVNVTTQQGNVWFGTDLAGAGPLNRWVTIDLGAAYALSHIEVFNSNQSDRGTGEISLYGANAVEVDADPFNGYTLTSPTLLINNASLTYAAGVNPIAGNIHTVDNQSAFRSRRPGRVWQSYAFLNSYPRLCPNPARGPRLDCSLLVPPLLVGADAGR